MTNDSALRASVLTTTRRLKELLWREHDGKEDEQERDRFLITTLLLDAVEILVRNREPSPDAVMRKTCGAITLMPAITGIRLEDYAVQFAAASWTSDFDRREKEGRVHAG